MSQPPHAPNAPLLDVELLYTEARAELDAQLTSFDAADAKIGIVLAVGVGEAAIVAAALALPHSSALPIWLAIIIGIPAGVSLVCLRHLGIQGRAGTGAGQTGHRS